MSEYCCISFGEMVEKKNVDNLEELGVVLLPLWEPCEECGGMKKYWLNIKCCPFCGSRLDGHK